MVLNIVSPAILDAPYTWLTFLGVLGIRVLNGTTVEALLTDTLVSGQLYLWTPFSIPLFDLFPLFLMEIILVSGQFY